MKIDICAISDTHNRHNKLKLKPGDLLIHAGDWSGMGYDWENERFVEWMAKQPYPAKVVIAGNHEKGVEANEPLFKQMCKEAGLIYLNDSSVNLQFMHGIVYIDQNIPDIETIKVHGSPMTPYFFNWAFNRARNEKQNVVYDHRTIRSFNIPLIKPHWDLIPLDTDILVTHGPPYGILDELVFVDGTPKGEFVGCEELLKRIKELPNIDLHFFGHIHTHGGKQIHKDGVSHYNASICDEMYTPINPVTYVEYDKSL